MNNHTISNMTERVPDDCPTNYFIVHAHFPRAAKAFFKLNSKHEKKNNMLILSKDTVNN